MFCFFENSCVVYFEKWFVYIIVDIFQAKKDFKKSTEVFYLRRKFVSSCKSSNTFVSQSYL